MTDQAPKMYHIDHVGVTVTDYDRSLTFYRDLLGMTEVEQVALPSGSKLAFLRMGDAGLVEIIYRDGNQGKRHVGGVPSNGHICLHVESLDAWMSYLAGNGIKLTSGPSTLQLPSGRTRLAFFEDPDGIPIELYEREHDV